MIYSDLHLSETISIIKKIDTKRIENMVDSDIINLSFNQLSGGFPDIMSNFIDDVSFSISNNNLSGVLPININTTIKYNTEYYNTEFAEKKCRLIDILAVAVSKCTIYLSYFIFIITLNLIRVS